MWVSSDTPALIFVRKTRSLPDRDAAPSPLRRGLCVGLSIALASLLQFLCDGLLKITGTPTYLLWAILLLALLLTASLLLRSKSWGIAENSVAPRPLIVNHLPLLCGITATLGLLVGLDDSLSLIRYTEYAEWHSFSRLFNAAGFLLAGWTADHYPMWLPLLALTAKSIVLGFHIFALEGGPFWIM